MYTMYDVISVCAILVCDSIIGQCIYSVVYLVFAVLLEELYSGKCSLGLNFVMELWRAPKQK